MKKVNTLAFVVLAIIAIYLLYKLIFVEELSKIDNVLLIILLAGGMINSSLIMSRRKKKRLEK